MNMGGIGRLLLTMAGLLAVLGLVLVLLDRFGIGRLPGDIVWRRDNVTVYIPFGLMILISLILTLLLNLFFRR
ncbi:MAG: DUF2905 family protein [Gemmatimonadota bacterium]|jgi:hypothetical protein